jgi:hypothetical protein
MLYLRNDFAWDCMQYNNLVSLDAGKTNDTIREFTELLAIKQERANRSLEEGEVIVDVEMGSEWDEVINSLADLGNQSIHNALLVRTNSFLEWSLVEMCRLIGIYTGVDYLRFQAPIKRQTKFWKRLKNWIKIKMGLPVERKPMKSILDRVRVYMETVLNINSNSGQWSRFTINAEVRHKIVHNNSNIITDYTKRLEEQPKYTTFNRHSAFNVSETGFIFVREMAYIQESHDAAVAYVNNLFQEVKTEMNRRGHPIVVQ